MPEAAYRGKPKASKALDFLLTRQGLPLVSESDTIGDHLAVTNVAAHASLTVNVTI
jgi:hypothetical protein